jgi:hypothetical protein
VSEAQVERTLVKSPPELWAELSDPGALVRHLGELSGEISITEVEHETTIVWEGERACGRVQLEPSGWGTRVILTVTQQDEAPAQAAPQLSVEEAPAEAPIDAAAAVAAAAAALPPRPRRLLARLLDHLRPLTAAAAVERAVLEPQASESGPTPPEPPPANAVALPPERAKEILASVLDALGRAHHRPFSRA